MAKGWLDPLKYGVSVECVVCQRMKRPVGRSVPVEAEDSLCGDECDGYRQDPQVGSLWPDESESDFGYEVGTRGVRYEGVER